MRPKLLIVFLTSFLMILSVSAHDLFLKLDTYFLAPNTRATVLEIIWSEDYRKRVLPVSTKYCTCAFAMAESYLNSC